MDTSQNPRPRPFVILGNPGVGRRVTLFQAALAGLGLPPARVVPYPDLLQGRVTLPEVVPPGAMVRIESPGKDFETERLLIAAGAEAAQQGAEADPPYHTLSAEAAARLPFDKGRFRYAHQWYLGLCATLARVEAQLAACPPHRSMNRPREIAAMFDKPRSHARLSRAGVPVPRCLGVARTFEGVRALMRAANGGGHGGSRRVFIKPAHGSSAAGIVAYRHDGGRHQAVSTIEMARAGGELRLYATRRIRTYERRHEIAALVDALGREDDLHVEAWVPKAGIDGCAFDLRVVVIDGRATHAVVRQSRSPMTNLHLLNARGNLDAVIARMGEAHWAEARRTCERAAACYPHALHAGLDLLITPDFRRHVVLEINAFGDLIPGILHAGRDTYTTEILSVMGEERMG